MQDAERIFKLIAEKFEVEFVEVSQGPMMSSPGIKYKTKVFTFYYKKKLYSNWARNLIRNLRGLKIFLI